ncbi:MAG: MBL fold metallo-hydrolase [Desulfobacteraceae bacterium]|nr:MBL fold metallo-hydrolase [Desulfobacteraceae bacterium]
MDNNIKTDQACEVTFNIVQNGTFEMTLETGVTDNRPTCSILRVTYKYLNHFEQYNVMIDIDHPVKDSADIIDSLASIGLMPEQVNIIILTHLHPDHIGHKDLFPNAVFIFHEAERFAFYFKDNQTFKLEGSAIWRVGNQSWPEYIDYTPDLKNLNNDIYIRHCSGHSKGSIVIFACINGLVHAFVGDIFLNKEYYQNWQPPGMSWKQEMIFPHMNFIKNNADIIIPGHGEPFRIGE